MATDFSVVEQRPGLQAIGGTQTQDVVFVGILTNPSGIYVEFPVLQKGYSAEIVDGAALGWATIAETLAAQPNVVGVQWTQLVNAANQLVSAWVITVASTSGNSAAQITVENNRLGPGLDKAAIANLHAELDKSEGL